MSESYVLKDAQCWSPLGWFQGLCQTLLVDLSDPLGNHDVKCITGKPFDFWWEGMATAAMHTRFSFFCLNT